MRTLHLPENWMFEKLENRQLMSSTLVDESGDSAYLEDNDEDVSEDEEDSPSRVMWILLDEIQSEIKGLFMYALKINMHVLGRVLSFLGEHLLHMDNLLSFIDFRKIQIDRIKDIDGEPMEWTGKSCMLAGALLEAIANGMQVDK